VEITHAKNFAMMAPAVTAQLFLKKSNLATAVKHL
jgi:hypothetical protein